MQLSRSVNVLVIQVCVLCAQILADPGEGRTPTGEWGEWTSWSTCSTDCSTGITVRSRRCQHPHLLPVASLLSRGDDTVWCSGEEKEVRICNKQACTDGRRGWREEECAKYDTSVHAGRRYTWEPFTHPSDPCKLTCRARGHHFYSNLADRVVDGTPCEGATTNPSAVCMQGICKPVGCDDVVGSLAKTDVCGMCKGDNSTCRKISGIYTRQDQRRGLNQVITIPVGSTQISIKGLRYSINRLALQYADGTFIFNGGSDRASPGDYEAAGTIFTYKTNKGCSGQCIIAQGPTDQAMNLVLNTRGRNRGVMYTFNVPTDVTDTYFRRIIGTSATSSTTNDSSAMVPNTQNPQTNPAVVPSTVTDNDDPTDVTTDAGNDLSTTSDDNEDVSVDPESASDDEDTGETYNSQSDEEEDDEEDDYPEEDEDSTEDSDTGLLPTPTVLQTEDDESDDSMSVDDYEDDEDLSEDGVGAPEPILQTTSRPDGAFRIIKKQKPKFIDPRDHRQGSFGHRAWKSELKSDLRSESDDVEDEDAEEEEEEEEEEDINDDLDSPQNPSYKQQAFKDVDPADSDSVDRTEKDGEQHNSTDSSQSVPGNTSDSRADGRVQATPLTVQDQLFRLQNDSPTSQYLYRTRSRSNRPHFRRRFRRPKYSQSFTFRRRYKQTVDAENKGLIGDETRYATRRNRTRPATPGSGRQIRFRRPPQGQYTQAQSGSGLDQPHGSAYDRIRSHSDLYGRRTPSQRQALTLGQSVSRDREEDVVIPGGRSSGTRQYGSRRRQLENSRQQQEYARKQEEYRRQLLRRRQQFEQQRAAQQAEYQRRREEHNRRLRQRQMEQQRWQQQNNNQQQYRHSHRRHNHGQRGTHHTRRQPGLAGSIPTGGIISRVDAPAGGSLQGVGGSGTIITRQRPTIPRRTLSSGIGRATTTTEDESGTGQDPSPEEVTTERRKDTTRARTTTSTERTSTHTASSREGSVHVDSTSAPSRPFLSSPAERPVQPTLPSSLPNTPTAGGGAPTPPRFVPEEPTFDTRSSLTGASSNQIPSSVDTPLVIGSEGNVVPNVFDNGILIGGDSSVSGSEEKEDGSPYEWRVSGLTECTLTCGGGVQQTVVVCLDTRTQAVVTDANCRQVQRPKTTSVTCNTRPCPAQWQSSQWSSCSKSCGPGEQSRLVSCVARISATLNLTMPDENCQGSVKPETRQACQNEACNTWKKGNWSECSVQCGEGVKTRDVYCVDQTGFDVSDDLCPGSKPIQREACEMGPCGKGWYYTEWPEQCPAQCGTGSMSRHVTCLGEAGHALPDSSCDSSSRPELRQSCTADSPCGGEWFIGEWAQCNVTCGRGFKEREVVCMKTLPGGLLSMVEEENCAQALKPEALDPCEADACTAEWYMTSWTQCSQSCGTGQRTREVKCLDPQQRPSSDCPLSGKPRTREACNTNSCAVRLPPPVDSSCVDTFSRCEIVRHARMCRFPYYRKKCCATCAEDT